MSQSPELKYYSMNLSDLRKLCFEQQIPNINTRSGRQQCVTALIKALKSPSKSLKKITNNRRQSLSNSIGARNRRRASHSHSPKFSKSKQRSRKRRRDQALEQDHIDDNQSFENSEQRRRKRRKTHTPSTMTTPERDRNLKSPIRNPRIATPTRLVSPPKPPMNYQSKDFISLLDSDDDTDHDVDIFNKDQNKNKNINIIKNRNKPSSISKKKVIRKTPSKQFLQKLQESSPEMSEEENDDNKRRLNSSRNKHKHHQAPKSFSDEDDEEEESEEFDNASDSHSNSPSPDQQTFYKDRTSKRDRIRSRYQDEMKSRSRSGSNIRNNRNVPNTTILRSKSKPKYQGYQSNPNISNSNISNPADITYIINNAKYKSKPSSSMPQTVVMSPSTLNPIRQASIKDISTDLDLQEQLNRIPKPEQLRDRPQTSTNTIPPIETKPTTFKSRIYEYYVSFATFIVNIWYCITWLPRKIWQLLTFLLEHWVYVSIIIVIILLLYSPTTKLIRQSRHFEKMYDSLFGDGIIYCDSCDNRNCELYIIDDCTPCPKNGHCRNGKFYGCNGDRTLIDGQCMYDPDEKRKLLEKMRISTINLLSKSCGEYQCQKYSLYKLIYSINDRNGNKMINEGLTEKGLSKQLSNLLGLQQESHLFGQIYQEFLQNIREATKEGSLYGNDLLYDGKKRYYFSNKPSKSLLCHLIILLSDYAYSIIPTILFVSTISILWINRQQKISQKRRAKQVIQDRKEQVIEILKYYLSNTNEKWIAILPIQKQIMGHTNKCQEWDRVEKEVDKDANIQKSLQMKDGLQKLCWKLSETALMN